MNVYGQTQYVSTRAPQLEDELDRIEALLVAETARRVHAAGEHFLEWPTVTRTWLRYDHRASLATPERRLRPDDPTAEYVRLQLEVIAEER